ncbi:MAG: CRISPR-associated endoribonuclease Cas6 [Candidatus Njordarchaeales archaeon]
MPMRLDYRVRVLEKSELRDFVGVFIFDWILNMVKNVSKRFRGASSFKSWCLAIHVKAMKSLNNEPFYTGCLTKDEEYSIGIAFLNDYLGEILSRKLLDSDKIMSGPLKLSVEAIKVRRNSFRELYHAKISSRIGLLFETPTVLGDYKTHANLFPEPPRLFERILDVWNKFAPKNLILPRNPLINWARENMRVRSYKLRARSFSIRDEFVKGFFGRLEIICQTREGLEYLAPLLNFLEYANIGEKNYYGFGAISYTDLSGIHPK